MTTTVSASGAARRRAGLAAAALCALALAATTAAAGAAEPHERTNPASATCPNALRWGLAEPEQERIVRCLIDRLRQRCRVGRLRHDRTLDEAALEGALSLAGRTDAYPDELAGALRAAAIVETSDLAPPRTTVRALIAEGRRALCARRFRRLGVGSSRVGEPTDDATRIWVIGLR